MCHSYLTFFQPDNDKRGEVSVQEAVQLLMDHHLSVRAYKAIRRLSLKGALPCYDDVKECKEETYPEGIVVDENQASVPVDKLLEHTAARILKTIDVPCKFATFSLLKMQPIK